MGFFSTVVQKPRSYVAPWVPPQGQPLQRIPLQPGQGSDQAWRPPRPAEVVPDAHGNISGGNGDNVEYPWLNDINTLASGIGNKYGAGFDALVKRASALGKRDWTKELVGQANENVNKEQTQFGNQLGAMGMRELGIRDDVTADWAKKRNEATTGARMSGQQMQQSALATMQAALNSAKGADLDAILAKLQALAQGGSQYLQAGALQAELARQKGAADAALNGGQGAQPPATPGPDGYPLYITDESKRVSPYQTLWKPPTSFWY